jgi:hypothetical protein
MSFNPIHTIEKQTDKGAQKLEIHYDEDPEDPHDDENIIKFAWSHRRYTFPNDSKLDVHDYSGWREYGDALPAKFKAIVYMIDHSGLFFRVNQNFSDCDPGQWDSGVVGWAYIDPQDAAENDVTEEKFLEYAKATVGTYNAYVNGRVYGANESLNGEPTDSCWGFYSFKDMVDVFPDFKEELEKL